MLLHHALLLDFEKALQFVSLRTVSDSGDVFVAMMGLLDLGRLADAGLLARRAIRLLRQADDPVEQGQLGEAIARYFARTGEWNAAEQTWKAAPVHQPFRVHAVAGPVRLSLIRALDEVNIALGKLHTASGPATFPSSLIQPRGSEERIKETADELEAIRQRLEELLPEDVRTDLGYTTGAKMHLPGRGEAARSRLSRSGGDRI